MNSQNDQISARPAAHPRTPHRELAMTTISTPLAGRVAVVVGASRGIGAAASRALSRAGAAVVVAARDEQALAALAEQITAGGGRALVVPPTLPTRPRCGGWWSRRWAPTGGWTLRSTTRPAAATGQRRWPMSPSTATTVS